MIRSIEALITITKKGGRGRSEDLAKASVKRRLGVLSPKRAGRNVLTLSRGRREKGKDSEKWKFNGRGGNGFHPPDWGLSEKGREKVQAECN